MPESQATIDGFKRTAAERAVAMITDGMIVGLGSGTTAEFALAALATRIAGGLRISGVPTSERTADLARQHGVPLVSFDGRPIDLAIDGADEIECNTLNLIKGGGASLVREKLVARASRRFIVIADERKLVDRLGVHSPLPVALLPFVRERALRELAALGAPGTIRQAGGRDVVTDDGLIIADCTCGAITDAQALATRIAAIPGVVDSGLFLGLAAEAIVAGQAGVRVLSPSK